ncbi:TPA: hypothetical protein ACXIGT_001315 [Serratia marcescens]|uniref:hypothetical protein n=1 Tax=Serratia bockelmannii TaxID=2703793 RepID=UPI003E338B65
MIYKVSSKKISEYQKYLIEKSRPPSRGGNGKALHSHVVIIDGVKYSFLANDSKQWVFKSDTVSFEYKIENGFNNISSIMEIIQIASRVDHVFFPDEYTKK